MQSKLRYKSEGEVHKDFHGLFCSTLHYLAENYGIESVQEILYKTAQDVYGSMRERLKGGDFDELAEYWEYYLKREQGVFELVKKNNGLCLTVKKCPAQEHLKALGREPDSILCEATRIFNQALCEGTGYELSCLQTGPCSCVQELKQMEEHINASK